MKPELMKKAAGYVRCSTDMQEKSIPDQKREISLWADQNGFAIVRWFEDPAKSGTSFEKRDSFMSLVKTVEQGADFDTALVYDESRWGRPADPSESGYWKQHLKRNGVRVIIINSRSNGGNILSDRFVEMLESSEAGEYSRKLSHATKRGQTTTAEEGYSTGGSAPYGYKRLAINKITHARRELLPGMHSHKCEEKVVFELGNPQEIEIIRRIFQLRRESLGTRAIANILNSENIPPPQRGRWRNKDQKWARVTINEILRNPTYTGCRVFNRHPQSHISGQDKLVWLNDSSKWVIKENAHPVIISKGLFDEVNTQRKPYARKNRHNNESPYLVSGLLKCKHCGFNFQGRTQQLKDSSGQLYKLYYYECGGYQNKGAAVCTSYLIKRDGIENHVIAAIINLIQQPSVLNQVKIAVKSRLEEGRLTTEREEEIYRQLENNKKQVERFLQLVKNGTHLSELDDELSRLQKERNHLDTTLTSLRSKIYSDDDVESIANRVDELNKNFIEIFRKAPFYLQKSLIGQFIEKIEVDRDTNRITCFIRKVPHLLTEMENCNKGFLAIKG